VRPQALAAALVLLLAPALAAAAPARFEDDWPGALAAARSSQRLVVVDAWAPW